jgi:hypothetical protein
MLTPEETKLLLYLRRHLSAALTELIAACLPGSPPEWAIRMLAQLEWLGYVVTYQGWNGKPALVQITERGLHQHH